MCNFEFCICLLDFHLHRSRLSVRDVCKQFLLRCSIHVDVGYLVFGIGPLQLYSNSDMLLIVGAGCMQATTDLHKTKLFEIFGPCRSSCPDPRQPCRLSLWPRFIWHGSPNNVHLLSTISVRGSWIYPRRQRTDTRTTNRPV